MKISECMTPKVQVVSPTQSLLEAANLMSELDIGVLPVAENDRLIGMITDRDIVVRGVAGGLGPEAAVREVMSSQVRYCFDDQSVEEVIRNMGDIQVRRLPVLNRDKRLVGIVSLGDVVQDIDNDEESASALRNISADKADGLSRERWS